MRITTTELISHFLGDKQSSYINSPSLHNNYVTCVLFGTILQMRKLRSYVQSQAIKVNSLNLKTR